MLSAPGAGSRDRTGLLSALTTEHSSLRAARSATVTESVGRSMIYLGSLSATLVALALIAQNESTVDDFRVCALFLLPMLVFLERSPSRGSSRRESRTRSTRRQSAGFAATTSSSQVTMPATSFSAVATIWRWHLLSDASSTRLTASRRSSVWHVIAPSLAEGSLRRQCAVTDERRSDVTTATQDGPTLADELLQRIGQVVGEKATVSVVFGDPVEREGITVIPVAKSRFAFGGGGGAGTHSGQEGSGGGGGGGAVVSPVGYIEVHDGSARFKRISGPVDLLTVVAAAALAALVVRRLLD